MRQGTNPIHDPEEAAILADTVAVLQELAGGDESVFEGGFFADQRIHRCVKAGIVAARQAGDLAPFREALGECKVLVLREFGGGGDA